MVNVERILCPIDFSDGSRLALTHALHLARWYRAQIVALHVLPPPMPPIDVFSSYAPPSPPPPVDRDAALRRLTEFVAFARLPGLTLEAVLADGKAAEEILRKSVAIHADLIVMGTHGLSGFERLVLGSVAEKVLRKATCPVLTIPPTARRPLPDSPLFETVVCGVDFSGPSLLASQLAVSLAREAKAHLTFVHVVESLPEADPPNTVHFNVPEYRTYLEADARKRMEGLLPAEVVAEMRPERIVRCGKAYRHILAIAEERHAGLIVLGVRGRAPFDLRLFGSTANHVVRHAPCPVLTVHGDEVGRPPSVEAELAEVRAGR